MSRPYERKPPGVVPPLRPATKVPPPRPIGKTPMEHAPSTHVARPPVEHPAGKPLNPRRLKPARDVHSGNLQDLFEFFPDLPRPARPAPHAPARSASASRAAGKSRTPSRRRVG